MTTSCFLSRVPEAREAELTPIRVPVTVPSDGSIGVTIARYPGLRGSILPVYGCGPAPDFDRTSPERQRATILRRRRHCTHVILGRATGFMGRAGRGVTRPPAAPPRIRRSRR